MHGTPWIQSLAVAVPLLVLAPPVAPAADAIPGPLRGVVRLDTMAVDGQRMTVGDAFDFAAAEMMATRETDMQGEGGRGGGRTGGDTGSDTGGNTGSDTETSAEEQASSKAQGGDAAADGSSDGSASDDSMEQGMEEFGAAMADFATILMMALAVNFYAAADALEHGVEIGVILEPDGAGGYRIRVPASNPEDAAEMEAMLPVLQQVGDGHYAGTAETVEDDGRIVVDIELKDDGSGAAYDLTVAVNGRGDEPDPELGIQEFDAVLVGSLAAGEITAEEMEAGMTAAFEEAMVRVQPRVTGVIEAMGLDPSMVLE